jgi:hypothetical protein
VLGPFPASEGLSAPSTVDGVTAQLRDALIEVSTADGLSAKLDIGAAMEAAVASQGSTPDPLINTAVRAEGVLGAERVTAVLTQGALFQRRAGGMLSDRGSYLLILTAVP